MQMFISFAKFLSDALARRVFRTTCLDRQRQAWKTQALRCASLQGMPRFLSFAILVLIVAGCAVGKNVVAGNVIPAGKCDSSCTLKSPGKLYERQHVC